MNAKVQRFYQIRSTIGSKQFSSGILWRDKFYSLEIERLRSRVFIAEEYSKSLSSVHMLPHYHLALFTDGNGSWINESGVHQAQEYDLLLIPPYSPHIILACRPETYRMIILTFRYRCNNEFLTLPFDKLIEIYTGDKTSKLPQNIHLSSIKASRLEEVMERLLDELLYIAPCREINVHTCFLQLITFIYNLKRIRKTDSALEIHAKIAKIKNSFDRNPENKTLLDELAGKINMSKEHFIRIFKKQYGIPPGRYRQERCIEKALTLLLNSNMKINAIAKDSGFENIFYFSKMFKKHFSVSPKEYRKQAYDD